MGYARDIRCARDIRYARDETHETRHAPDINLAPDQNVVLMKIYHFAVAPASPEERWGPSEDPGVGGRCPGLSGREAANPTESSCGSGTEGGATTIHQNRAGAAER